MEAQCHHAVGFNLSAVCVRVPMCVLTRTSVPVRVHDARASMFLTCWLLSQSICPAESQGPTREPHVGGAIPTQQEQAPPQT